MAIIKKTPSELRSVEVEIHKALKSWYLTPGLQRDLLNKENEAVQKVLEVLERRMRLRVSSRAEAIEVRLS